VGIGVKFTLLRFSQPVKGIIPKSVIVPDNVTSVKALQSSNALSPMDVSKYVKADETAGVTSLAPSAFEGCVNLREIDLSQSAISNRTR